MFKIFNRFFISLYIFISAACAVFAQQTITGTVTDENGKPLSAVSIYMSQSKRGTITNIDGDFSLRTALNEDSLIASYIGYESFKIKINSKNVNLKIKLKPAVFTLGEVVVTNLSAAELLKSVIRKIPENYEQTPFLIKAYYRAKASEKDTLLYTEETAFNIIKSYKSGFADKYFLEKNRNFRFTSHKINWHGIGWSDCVSFASRLFNNSLFRNRDIRYLPSTFYDNRLVYVLSISQRNSGNIQPSKIYIDVEDLAIIRVEIESENGDRAISQYKKIDGKYYFISGYSLHINRFIGNRISPVESNIVTTDIIHNFSPDDIAGTPVDTHDYLETYATEGDSIFWEEHNSLLPDSTIRTAIENLQQSGSKATNPVPDSAQYLSYIKPLFRPSIFLSHSTNMSKDFALLNQNSIFVNRAINSFIYRKLGMASKGILASTLYFALSMPFEEVLSEYRLLSINNIRTNINPTIFNKASNTYLFGLSDDAFSEYKASHFDNFMRLHTIREEGHLIKAQIIEEELARIDLSNKNNRRRYMLFYGLDLFLYRISAAYNPFSKDANPINLPAIKQPFIIDRNRSWVKYLFNPDAEYSRHITSANLTKEEQDYLKRSAWLSWINIISPQMFGTGKIKLSKSASFTFSMNYHRAPFGEMFGQNIYLVTNYDMLHGIYLRQYKNHEKTSFGIGYKLFNLKLSKSINLTSALDYWQQPSDLDFYSKSSSGGFHIEQTLEYNLLPDKYTRQHRLSMLSGYDFKTSGYLPQSYFMNENFSIKAGFKWYY
jgi:hypothetical protein